MTQNTDAQMAPLKFDVVIVGGGMVGAATALGLAQGGVNVALLERNEPDLSWSDNKPYQARVSALTRASENILRHLNAWQGIERRRAHAFIAMRIWEDATDAEISFDAASLNEPNLGYVVENQVIQAALWEQLEPAGVQVFCGHSLQNLRFDNHQAWLSVEGLAEMQTSLLIGADGAFSQVRSLAGIGLDQHDYAQCAVVGCVRTQAPHQDTCWQRYQADGPFAYLAMDDNVSSIAWYLPVEKMQWALDLSEEDYRAELFKASDGRLGEITQTWTRAAFPLTRRHAQQYVKPNLALVGDAAHTIHPQAGQGVNLGLLDAATLVDVLLQAKRAGEYLGDQAVLRRYERWRKGDNLIVQRAMEGFDWLFKSDHGMKDQLRQRLLPLANVAKPLKNWLIQQALYGRDPLPNLAKKSH
ncbi:FAD-dependent oxidoreductase [Thiomicrospira pelophila]|uniref:FAD-dependent oxidoreductase n=1 Tax=Thiomicrospira pelophila TaxID=934 RepID=UPI0004A7778D|nr:FAD-dependent oxidoreductase [Thiomicrospira pelophila]